MSTNGHSRNGKANGAATDSRLNLDAQSPIDRVIHRLERMGYKPESTGPQEWRSRCPGHEGTSKNLSIKEGSDGTVLLNCHHARDGAPTCTAKVIVEALGLEMSDLFPKARKPERARPLKPTAKPVARPKAEKPNRIRAASPEAAIRGVVRKKGEPTGRWIYRDVDGTELMRIYRFKTGPEPKDKEFRPVHPDADGWYLGAPPDPLPLYRLDRIVAADLVIVVEGEKCADLVASLGLESTTSAHGAKSPGKTDWKPLAGKDVAIFPDNDASGEGYIQDVAAILWELKPRPRIRILRPPLKEKGDDVEQWLEAQPEAWSPADCGDELRRLALAAPPWSPPPPPSAEADSPGFGYANFDARIVREIVRHEADEVSFHYEIEVTHRDDLDSGRKVMVIVPEGEFESMSWVTKRLGLRYTINTGRTIKDTFQHAIRIRSMKKGGSLMTKHVYPALGWERIDGRDYYLHAGGLIGAIGAPEPPPVDVDLPTDLAAYKLPRPDLSRLAQAVAKILAIPSHLGPDAAGAAAILCCFPFRAVLGPSRSTPHFAGTTGTFKTSTAAIAVRFLAPGLEYDDTMPASYASTNAGLERIRHVSRDSIVIIDNLIADGEQGGREMSKANRLFNSQGDLANPDRMGADGKPMLRKDPRGSLFSTGEIELDRQSAGARAITVEFRPEMVPLHGLKACHADARAGWYAQAVACYLAHLAADNRLMVARAELRHLAVEYREAAAKTCKKCHARQLEAVAEWTSAWHLFLDFAVSASALTRAAADRALEQVRAALFKLLAAQAEMQEETDPAEKFLEFLAEALSSKRAVLVGLDGLAPPPEIAGACGWERRVTDFKGNACPMWETAAGSQRIGWVDEDSIYLIPKTAHAAAEQLARISRRTIGAERQIWARLAETGKITPQIHRGRRRFARQIYAEGGRPWVICLDRSLLIGPDPADSDASGGPRDAQSPDLPPESEVSEVKDWFDQ